MNPKGRRKAKPKVELVTKCDHCGKRFGNTPSGMTHARTANSAVIATSINGIVVRCDTKGRWSFYCCHECAEVGE
jgi:hypothetical protein